MRQFASFSIYTYVKSKLFGFFFDLWKQTFCKFHLKAVKMGKKENYQVFFSAVIAQPLLDVSNFQIVLVSTTMLNIDVLNRHFYRPNYNSHLSLAILTST